MSEKLSEFVTDSILLVIGVLYYISRYVVSEFVWIRQLRDSQRVMKFVVTLFKRKVKIKLVIFVRK